MQGHNSQALGGLSQAQGGPPYLGTTFYLHRTLQLLASCTISQHFAAYQQHKIQVLCNLESLKFGMEEEHLL